MKTLTIISLLILISTQLFAQQDLDKSLYIRKAEKYRKMKNIGAILTIGGTALAIGGIVSLSSTSTNPSGNRVGDDIFPRGIFAFLFGSSAAGTGIPLWIVGAHAERKYKSKLENLSVKVNLNRQQMGFGLAYTF